MQSRTPVILITGSLGSGKTTLLKRILDSVRQSVAVVMNEFGEIAIDSRVLQGEDVRIVELVGGGHCSSFIGDFEAAVREILGVSRPHFIVVETTGVSEADALVFELEERLPQVRLDSVVHVVDAYLTLKHPYFGRATEKHLEAADIILINKIDLLNTDQIKAVEDQVRLFNDRAILFKTVGCDVNANLLFGMVTRKGSTPMQCRGMTEFQTFTYSTDAFLDEKMFMNVIASLGTSVYRAKGFVRFPGVSRLFNYVLGRTDLEDHEAGGTELVFIGCRLEDMVDVIQRKLKSCEVSNAL